MSFPIIDSRIHLSQSSASIVISHLVQAIACTDEPAFHVALDAAGEEQVMPTSLSELFKYMPLIKGDHADHYDDNHLEVFWTAYQGMGFENSPFGLVCMNNAETGYLSTAQMMNALVDRIRQLVG
ncbi:hypothetical protein QN412_21205 [Pseudomonas sp. RTB3]|uniref:hypothetical protein n=1 Tax=unclassified Pseudomonas TaxID=196821 RepID=UPI002B224F68|nr:MULTISPECIES: hypothetical protein [unclassified Pseudomonas]MEB0007260.1 hypothetical protein [Pseudomonas sp. RTB2]MEB0019443.1 hypothetical protein [Pseudomonas sp. RTB3]MEB0270400.1 hypothetical protein [Pseudomonas sp. 5B4]